MPIHKPVLVNEVIKYLEVKPNENFVDCTIGEGGHTKIILEKTAPNGKILGIDLDINQIESSKLLKEKFGERLILVNDNYANLIDIINKNNFTKVSGILADIGFSSFQTDESKKGFSFQRNEPLDMRYNLGENNLTAKTIINEWPGVEIEKILEDYGEEKFSKQIVKRILEERKINEIETTFQLVELIKKAVPHKFQYGKIHCATKAFQALRIAVNGELKNLMKVLPQALSVLESGGRLVVISFHSLEDRIVKNFFKQEAEKGIIKILTKKPIEATEKEINENLRARSAKLRAIIKF